MVQSSSQSGCSEDEVSDPHVPVGLFPSYSKRAGPRPEAVVVGPGDTAFLVNADLGQRKSGQTYASRSTAISHRTAGIGNRANPSATIMRTARASTAVSYVSETAGAREERVSQQAAGHALPF